MKGFALGLALKQRRNATQKSPIRLANQDLEVFWFWSQPAPFQLLVCRDRPGEGSL